MRIIARATNFTKGSPATLTLSKAALAQLPGVAADPYFSDQQNWKKIMVNYRTAAGLQRVAVQFNGREDVPTGTFSASSKARDEFFIEAITIFDYDQGWLTVKASELLPADFKIDFVSTYTDVLGPVEEPINANAIEWDNFGSGHQYTVGPNGQISSSGSEPEYAISTVALDGDFELTYTFNDDQMGLFYTAGVTEFLHGGGYDPYSLIAFTLKEYGESIYDMGENIPLGLSRVSGLNTFKLVRVGSTLSFFLNGVEAAFTRTHAGTLYPAVRLLGTVLSASVVQQAGSESLPSFTNTSSAATVIDTETGSFQRTSGVGDWGTGYAWGNTAIEGDFTFTGEMVFGNDVHSFLGYTKNVPAPQSTGGPYNNAHALDKGIYIHSTLDVYNKAAGGLESTVLQSVTLGQPYQFEIKRLGSTITFFVTYDGVRTQAYTEEFSGEVYLSVASYSAGGLHVTSSQLIPSAVAETPVSAGSSESLLMHFDGADGSQTFVDSSENQRQVTSVNGAYQTVSGKFGNALAFSTPGGSSYAEIVESKSNLLGDGDFTVECWFNVLGADNGQGNRIIGTLAEGQPKAGFLLVHSGGALRLLVNDASGNADSFKYINVGTIGVPSTQWTHAAVVKEGNAIKLYTNGALSFEGDLTGTNLDFDQMKIGAYNAGGYGFNGLIDEVRIMKSAVYTADFTVPSAPFGA